VKKLQIISAAILVLSVFVTIDLGVNFAYSLVPELNDGIGSHSILQGWFGIFGGSGWTKRTFLSAFETSLWISFLLFAENIVVWLFSRREG